MEPPCMRWRPDEAPRELMMRINRPIQQSLVAERFEITWNVHVVGSDETVDTTTSPTEIRF